MFDKELYNYPIEKVLEALGARKGPGKDMWFSPFREETRASLHIDKEKNLWNDFGLGQGGSIVQLVMLARRCNCRDAEAFIASLSPCMYEKPEPSAPKSEIKAVSEIRSDYLINYLQKRKIPLELARQYCKEVIVRNPQKGMNFTLLGFPNNMGGYALNAPTGFKSTTKAAVTTINTEGKMSVTPSSKSVAVFEGFFDFLSWQMMQGSKTPSCDIVVLNSVNNLQKATAFIGAHEKITGFLDNDEAGQKCQTALERLFPGKVTDMSDLYGKNKDLNEMLQNSRGYTAEMKLTPHA